MLSPPSAAGLKEELLHGPSLGAPSGARPEGSEQGYCSVTVSVSSLDLLLLGYLRPWELMVVCLAVCCSSGGQAVRDSILLLPAQGCWHAGPAL